MRIHPAVKFFTAVFVFSLVMAAPSQWALAQGIDGTLRGDVKDPSGAVVPAAKVTVTNEQTGLHRTMEASSVGTFYFPNLLVGTYTVTVEFRGFKKFVQAGVEVKANSVAEVTVALEVGSAATTVEVTAGAELVQTTTSQLSTSWDSRQIADIPLPVLTGDPMNMAILQAGTSTQSGGVLGVGGSIGGNRPRNNSFVLDGIDNNDISVTGPMQSVIPDAVAEFTLVTNQFSAEYGHSTAGQFIETTKSGTNTLHGSAFEYLNNRRLNSVDNLTAQAIASGQLDGKPRYDRNQFGGTLGGPIKKDKIFLFGAFQYTGTFEASTPGAITSVPTAAGLSALATLAGTPGSGVSATMVNILKTYLTPAPVATDTENVINEATTPGTAVPIDIGVLTPSAPNYNRTYNWNLDLDVNTARHRFSGRFLFDRFRAPNAPMFPLPEFMGTYLGDARSVTFADAFSLSPQVINEFRVGYRRSNGVWDVPDVTPPSSLDVFPNFEIDSLSLNLGPESNSPQFGFTNVYQATDTLSWVRGRHTIKAGADFRVWIAPTSFLPRERAEYDWSSLDSFVKDEIPDGGNGAIRGVGTSVFAGNQKAIYWFLQDDVKIHPRFTLNIGVRYEYMTNPRDAATQSLNSTADLTSPTMAGFPPLIFGKPKSDTNNWAPRFGFAWDVFGDHKTSVRGGVGVAYDVIFQNLVLLQLPPQLQAEYTPDVVCAAATPPSWCPSGPGFIAGGAISASGFVVGTKPTADARAETQSLIVDTVSPKTFTWSLSVQRELAPNWSVEARYVGTRGLELPVQYRRNAKIPPASDLFLPTYFSNSEVPATVPLTAPSLADFSAAAVRPYAADGFYGSITAFDPIGDSIYHGGSLEVTRRMSNLGRWGNGLFLKSGYTWSKTIDNSTNELMSSYVNPRRPQNFLNIRDERGLSALDHRHKFTIALIYQLPKYTGSDGALKGVLDGWELGSSFIAESGQPVTPLSFMDSNGNGDSAGDRAIINPSGQGLTATDANMVCRDPATGATSIVASCASSRTVGYVAIDPTARFVAAYPGARTNSGRNMLTTAGINNWNLTFMKDTHITESKYIQFRVQMNNAFNHPQPSVGSGNINQLGANAENYELVYVGDNPNFMKPFNIFSTTSRYIMFGVKFIF
jgi:hypothetical protein